MDLDSNLIIVLSFVFGSAIVFFVLALGFAAYQRHLRHKERMAMIEQGLTPPELEGRGPGGSWGWGGGGGSGASPIVVTLVGVAITVGLLTIGVGPWLVGGLVPTAVGVGMLIRELREEARGRRGDE